MSLKIVLRYYLISVFAHIIRTLTNASHIPLTHPYMKPSDEELVNASNRFHEALATGDYKGFCATKSASAETESDKQVEWTVHTPAEYYLYYRVSSS